MCPTHNNGGHDPALHRHCSAHCLRSVLLKICLYGENHSHIQILNAKYECTRTSAMCCDADRMVNLGHQMVIITYVHQWNTLQLQLVSDVVSLHDKSNSRRGPFMVDTLSVRYSCVTQIGHGLTSSLHQILRYFPIPIRGSDNTL